MKQHEKTEAEIRIDKDLSSAEESLQAEQMLAALASTRKSAYSKRGVTKSLFNREKVRKAGKFKKIARKISRPNQKRSKKTHTHRCGIT